MKTFKIFLENAAENLAALRANSERRKQELLQQIATRRQQKLEDKELEKTINKEIEEREKAKANIRRQKR
jgi:phosphoenolpyruvate-protein kinase (PTS system EI component)